MSDKKLLLNDEVQISGWWTGGIRVTTKLTDEILEDLGADPDNWEIMKGITSNDNTDECVRVSFFDDWFTNIIRERMLAGDDYGTIQTEHGDVGWDATFDCKLDEKEIDFWDLSDYTREYVINTALEGYHQGELYEYKEEDYELTFGEMQYSPEKGSVSTNVHIENLTEDVELEYDCQMSYDDVNGIKFTLDNLDDELKLDAEYFLDNHIMEIRNRLEPKLQESLSTFRKTQASQKKDISAIKNAVNDVKNIDAGKDKAKSKAIGRE